MAQQFHGMGGHDGSRTISDRDSRRYAIINPPFGGKHTKPQTAEYARRRKAHQAAKLTAARLARMKEGYR